MEIDPTAKTNKNKDRQVDPRFVGFLVYTNEGPIHFFRIRGGTYNPDHIYRFTEVTIQTSQSRFRISYMDRAERIKHVALNYSEKNPVFTFYDEGDRYRYEKFLPF